MIAYCGIDCSKCFSFLATQSGSREELEKVAKRFTELFHTEVKPEYVVCDGCKEDKRHSYFCSNMCKMRKCCTERGYETCIECAEYPCKELLVEFEHVPDARINLEKLRKQ